MTSYERHVVPKSWTTRLFSTSCLCWEERKHRRFELLALCEGYPLVVGGSPYRGSAMRKTFPCYNVNMNTKTLPCTCIRPADGFIFIMKIHMYIVRQYICYKTFYWLPYTLIFMAVCVNMICGHWLHPWLLSQAPPVHLVIALWS